MVIVLLIGMPVMPEIQAQLISVRSEVARDSMMIGDQQRFSLHVEADTELEFRMPRWTDSTGNTLQFMGRDLEVLAFLSADTSFAEGKRVVNHHYLFTGFEGGSHMIPALEVSYQFKGRLDTARSMPLFIQIAEPEVDTSEQIKPIKAPINTPVNFAEILPWAGLALGILLLGVGSYILLRRYLRRKQHPEVFAMKKKEAAHVIAFRELDALKEQKMWESGQVKAFYTRLTEITRRYIENQYGIPAMESVSEEIIEAFQRVNSEGELLDEMLRDLLQLADLVKFAKEDPLPVENQTHLNNAYIFVQKTYPLFYVEETQNKEQEKGGSHE